MIRRSLPLLALLLLINDTAIAVDPVLVITPRAQVLPVSPTNRPFLAAGQTLQPMDLAARGYVESELRVAGRANVYERSSSDGLKARVADVPYATRILVRQPKDVARSSGRVIVELLDATAGYDSAPLWGLSWEYFTRHGDVWVGVTVNPAAAAALHRFDGVRYGSMALGAPQSESCGGANSSSGANGLVWDVVAQVGALLRSSSKENPLLVLNPQRFIAAGYGQSGGYVVTFANTLHAWQRLGDGAPIFDGYLSAAITDSAPLDSCASTDKSARPFVSPRDAPFVSVLTESDVQATQFRDHSDAPSDVFRLYEIAGAAHSGPFPAGQPAAADLTIAGVPPLAEGLCREARTSFSATYALNAIWQQYDELLLHQLPMSREPRLDADASGLLRDAAGNARGGWRLPQMEVPVATYRGSSTPRADDASSRQLCAMTGSQQPMNAAALKTRYGSRAEYLRRFNAAVDEALRQRRIVAEDVATLKASGQRAPAF